MKRLLTLTLALLMALSLFAIGGKNYARAEEAASKYVGLWEITGCEEDGTFISSAEAGHRIYMSFLPSGIIYAVNLHGSEWEEAYYAYRANGEDALYKIPRLDVNDLPKDSNSPVNEWWYKG